MAVLVYLNLVSLECYSKSMDVIIKTKLTRDKRNCQEVFCKKSVSKSLSYGFLMFSWGTERVHWKRIGQNTDVSVSPMQKSLIY